MYVKDNITMTNNEIRLKIIKRTHEEKIKVVSSFRKNIAVVFVIQAFFCFLNPHFFYFLLFALYFGVSFYNLKEHLNWMENSKNLSLEKVANEKEKD